MTKGNNLSSGIKFIVVSKTITMQNNSPSPEADKNESKLFETDSEKIVRRHLADEGDEITDEDIRNVRIVGEDDEPTTIAAEAESQFEKNDSEEETGTPGPDAKPGTPWDVLSE